MVGEIGGNDINYALGQGKSIKEVRIMVPVIVRAIKDAVLVSFHRNLIHFLLRTSHICIQPHSKEDSHLFKKKDYPRGKSINFSMKVGRDNLHNG